MGPAVVDYRFRRLPSVFRYFPRAVFGRRGALVPDGQTVPHLAGSVESVHARPNHLARYREVCGFTDDGHLPITYPHVLAMPLHYALLTNPRFVVRIMGLIHIGNEIEQARPLPGSRGFGLRSWIEGHRETERGHEFDLFTAVEDGEGTAWREKSTLLARRPSGGRQCRAKRTPDAALRKTRGIRPAGRRRYRGAPCDGKALRLALRRPQSDPPRRPRREDVRVRAGRRARHVVDGADARCARHGGARATCEGPRRVQVSALHALRRPPRALAARWSPRVRAEGLRERAPVPCRLDADCLNRWLPH